MAIGVVCDCGRAMQVREEYAGKTVRCKGCQSPVPVPEPLAEPFPPIDTSEPEETEPERPPLHKHIMGSFADAWKSEPDTRTVDEKRWDRLLYLLGGIASRLTWILVVLILLSLRSCAPFDVAVRSLGR